MKNVFKWGYSRKWYLTHPWKWVKELFRNIKFAWQRATRGYCDGDVWSIDSWLLALLPDMLRDLANDAVGAYPGYEPFETPEKWRNWLLKMAVRFLELQDDWSETRNEYENEYFKLIDEGRVIEKRQDGTVCCNFIFKDEEYTKELRQKWLSRIKELRQEQDAATIAAFSELAEHFYALWS